MHHMYFILHFCYILSLTEIKKNSGTLVTCNMLIFGNLVVNPVHFLLTENIKRDNKGIILWFYYLVQNINVDALMWFFCWISTILMQCLEISSLLSTVSQFVSHIIFIFYHTALILSFFFFLKYKISICNVIRYL